MDRNKIMSEA
jgi:hypothetical protein